ncbi:tetratricopeptide repeat protein [Mucilaginibacter arboris]|uniref:Tetratricopeptide repeat protein n=1 Tax=Mucilaginibacter arboris TaxID=2682090 RepID=A0A7K1SRU8_9SPHI|nr:tetratricopeptide repeat protein [Mucilaginibacter arboris]MVN20046.1 tetratricopeptide repeat protein [Mucilaginibacter arboris]
MKMINKAAMTISGLAMLSSSVFAQSLADAKKAIDAEQYQKAESMLKNLTQTQPSKDENYFYLGWLYLKKDYSDSARATFTKGISINPKSALNYAGLGAADRVDKNTAAAKSNFDKAVAVIDKKDTEPYVYIGKAYLLDPNPDANAAIQILQKGIAANPKEKNPELYAALGDAYRSQLKNTDAYDNYTQALAINPKMVSAVVATGVIWKQANNFEDSEKEYRKALSIDPSYGPAYRELAETYLRWGRNSTKTVSEQKYKQAVDFYKKYLDLTDRSIDSRLRYAEFLVYAEDYKALEQEANELAKIAPKNDLIVYRFLGYSAYENKNYAAGLDALNKFISQANPKRIIPLDYLYQGRLQIALGQDSLGINSLRKALQLDTNQVEAYGEIAKSLYNQKKYLEAGDAYKTYIAKSHEATLNDYLREGVSYYNAFKAQYYSTATPKPIPDTTLIVKADTAFNYIQKHATAPIATVALYEARANDLKEPSRNTSQGYAKPYYEQYIQLITAKGPVADADKQFLAEAYVYLGTYYEYVEKNEAKAAENFAKAKENDPTNKQVADFFARKGGGAGKSK